MGAHYIYYALKSENYQFKLGFFIHVSLKSQIFIKKWDENVEDYVQLTEEEEA